MTNLKGKQAMRADRGVPALVIKIGHYPLHSGGVAAIRTLGRLGVPVYAITEDRATPAALSRYCTGRFVWRTTGREDPELLVDGLREIGRRLGRRSVAVPVDDESAVLLAEHAAALSEYFLFPSVPPGLPRKLADKQSLHELCLGHGVPTPQSMVPSSAAELAAFAAGASYPVVAKNAEVWTRRRAPAVPSTTVLHSADELLALARGGATPSVMLQEYIPADDSEDWIVQAYCDASSRCLVLGTGVKVRSWPPHTGATSCAYVVANPGLAEQARRFFAEIGFRGIADLDWRLDRRDGQYKLVDFNPRMGNQFRLFQTVAGVDVVRALHLDLTGRPVPAGQQVNGRRIVIEHADLPARLAHRSSGHAPSSAPRHATSTELAWLATDDPMPFLAVWPRLASLAVAYLGVIRPQWVRRRVRPQWARPLRPGPHDQRRTGLKDFWSAARRDTTRRERCHMTTSDSSTAVVIGAGPYGLSVAAHLRARGVSVRVFGEVMSTWRDHMPAGMFLKSTPDASSISAPAAGFTLGAFCAQDGPRALREDEAVPIGLFVRYGQWFAERLVPDVEQRRVCRLERADRRFHLTLDDGEELQTDTVVLAVGTTDFAYLPDELAAAVPAGPSPAAAVSHSSQHRDLSGFRGRDVAVIGAGQSALETAALLHEAGAAVRVLTRGHARFGYPPKAPPRGPLAVLPRPHSPLGPTWRIYPFSHAPALFRYLPPQTRLRLVQRVLGPLGAWWLRDRVEGRIPLLDGQRVLRARQDGDKVLLTLDSGGGQHGELTADHVIAATGYRIDLEKLGFLGPDLRAGIRTLDGWPCLSGDSESSVPGLFFAGLTAAATFGPVMRFVCGTQFAARRISAAVAGRAGRLASTKTKEADASAHLSR